MGALRVKVLGYNGIVMVGGMVEVRPPTAMRGVHPANETPAIRTLLPQNVHGSNVAPTQGG